MLQDIFLFLNIKTIIFIEFNYKLDFNIFNIKNNIQYMCTNSLES